MSRMQGNETGPEPDAELDITDVAPDPVALAAPGHRDNGTGTGDDDTGNDAP